MGGRGSFAAEKSVERTYKTVGYIEGVKVLEGLNGKHSLPESSHSSNAYIKLKPNGTFHEMRIYDENHVLKLEIAYHPESKLTGNGNTPVLHYHAYSEGFSKSGILGFERSTAKLLTAEMIEKYGKYFIGVKLK